MNIFINWLAGLAVFLHLISPAVPTIAAVQTPVVSQADVLPVATNPVKNSTEIVVSPAPVAATQVQVVTPTLAPVTYTLPNGTVIDAQGNVVNQADVDTQNQATAQQSAAAQNALRLLQAQAAASSSNAILQTNAAALKASQIKTLENQISTAQFAIVTDQQELLNLQASLEIANSDQTFQPRPPTLQKEINETNLDISEQQNTVQSVQVQIDVLNQ